MKILLHLQNIIIIIKLSIAPLELSGFQRHLTIS